jgi:uncharacterized delta-60 repeat protein
MRTPRFTTNLVLATVAVVLAVLLRGAPAADAASGLKLDRAFGHRGTAAPALGPAYGSTEFVSAHVNADGTLVAGRHEGQNGEGVATFRFYGAAGSPQGEIETRFEVSTPEVADAEGRYLIGGENHLIRLRADGTPDPSFGEIDVYDRRWSDWIPCKVEAILPLPSGRIVAGGSGCVSRPNADGKGDEAFGDKGSLALASLGITGRKLELVGIAPGPGDSLLLALNRSRSAPYGEKTLPDGSLVTAITPSDGSESTWGRTWTVELEATLGAIAPVAGGGVLLAGERWGREIDEINSESDAVLIQLGPDGTRSANFGLGGEAGLDLGDVDIVNAIAVQPDRGALIAGATTKAPQACSDWEQFCDETPFVARFTAGGSRDTAYGRDGVSLLDRLRYEYAPVQGEGVLGLSLRPGGGVLAWGGGGINGFLAALGPDGALDPAFGDAGIRVEQRKGASSVSSHVIGVDGKGRTLVLGGTNSGVAPGAPPGALLRFRPGGDLDRGFGEGGFVRVPGNSRALAVGPHGDAFVLSGEFGPNLVVHVTAGGRLDPRFGVDGSAPLPDLPPVIRHGKQRRVELDPRAIVALPHGGALIGGESGEVGGGGLTRMVVVRLNAKGRPARSFGHRGIATVAFGRRGNCNLAAMSAAPGGRILLAGKIRTGPTQRQVLAVVAIRRNGRVDRGFGSAGLALAPLRGDSRATAIAVDRRGIVVGGRQGTHKKSRLLLMRFSADGRLDRSFAARVWKTWPRPAKRLNVPEPSQMLPVGGDLVLINRLGLAVTVFSRAGAYKGAIAEDPKARPREYVAGAAVQRGRLVISSNRRAGNRRNSLILRRYLPR